MHRGLLAALDGIVVDVRCALRRLRSTPGFTLVAVATLAVGIGANAAVFSVTNALLFKGFSGVDRNERIVYITEGDGRFGASYADFEDWRAQAESFEGMGLVAGAAGVVENTTDASVSYSVTAVTTDAFDVLGVKPMLGRGFERSDALPGAAAVVILTYDFWKRRFEGDRAAVGRTIRLDGSSVTVIGVMPPRFSFPFNQDLWRPIVADAKFQRRDDRQAFRFAFGRLTESATVASARAEMTAIAQRLAAAYPETNRDIRPSLRTYDEFFIDGKAIRLYEVLWAAAGFVLLIACANVANLLLSRAMSRSRELSIRAALGAGRWRSARQLLLESLLLGSLGGFCGWWVAEIGVRLYVHLQSRADVQAFGHVLDYTMDYRVLVYAAGISFVAAVLFGLLPLSRLSRLDVITGLKEGGRSATDGPRGVRLSSLLIIGQVALAAVLLSGAGVMIRSFFNVYSADVGVGTDDILSGFLALPVERYSESNTQLAFYDRVSARLEALPGVESVAMATAFPTSDTFWTPRYETSDAAGPDATQNLPTVGTVVISPDYFRTLGAVVRSGRTFNDFDDSSSSRVVIVNQQFADTVWPREDPLGKRLRLIDEGAAVDGLREDESGSEPADRPGDWLTVVGVVSNIVQSDHTRQRFDPLLYVPFRQQPRGYANVLIRARQRPEMLIGAVDRAVHALDPNLSVRILPLTEWLSEMQGPYVLRRSIAVLLPVFAGIALSLAFIGLYALVAYAVTRRMQEFGIRAAMGASAGRIKRLVFRQGALPLGAGLAIGLGASRAVNGVLESQLVGVSPSDPLTLVVVSAVLLAAAVLGCAVPARRAARVDPMTVLREG